MPVMKQLRIGSATYDTVGEASVTQVQTSGTKIATVTIDGTSTDLYAPEGGGGGSTVTVTQTLTSGTEIASVSVDGTATKLYAPTYTLPTASTSTLGGVKVDGSTITIADGVISSSGGGGSVTMEDTAVDAAVGAAWPAGSYEITNGLPANLSIDKAEASEGETVTVEVTARIMLDPVSGLGVLDSYTHETLLVLVQAGGGKIPAGAIYTFSMPATDVTVSNFTG